MSMPWRRRCGLLAAACLALSGVACSDDDNDDADDAAEETTTTAADEADATTTTDDEATGEVIEVTASNYRFDGVPATVAGGSSFSLTTAADGEPHEFVLVAVPAAETRSVEELIALPEAELEAMFAAEPALVTIAMPGTTDTPGPVVGDGTITEPGRYLYLCTFPEGTTPEAVTNATGPLEGENPHYLLGMRGEFTVE